MTSQPSRRSTPRGAIRLPWRPVLAGETAGPDREPSSASGEPSAGPAPGAPGLRGRSFRLKASGIVLAGGRSRRFGRDKLAEPLLGRPLLHRSVLALAPVCGEVIVAGPPDPRALPPLPDLPIPLRVVGDPEPYGGPLVGVRVGLEAARWPLAVVVGGDMPDLAPALLAAMLRLLEEGSEAVACCEAGRLRPLPCALRTSVLATVRRQLASGRRSLHELLAALSTHELDEPAWRALDPSAGSLRDVDRPGDLD